MAKKTGSRSKSRSRRSSGGTDAYSLLKQDHDKVQKLFRDFEKLSERESDTAEIAMLAEQICTELTVHTRIEEEIFYPALREALDEDDAELLDEAEIEHESAKTLIAQIEERETGDEMFAARVKVLGEYVKHHIREEQDEIFPAARKAKVDAEALGEEISARKAELMEEMGMSQDMEDEEEAVEMPRRRAGNGSGRTAQR